MFQVKNAETTNKTLRFPIDLLARLDVVAHSHRISVSKLIFQSCEFALDSLTKGGRPR